MKLWLDDRRPLPYDYDIQVKNAKIAIVLIMTGLITEVSLDNDLGDIDWNGCPTGEGRHVAAAIEKAAYSGDLRRIKWHVHTSNPVADKNMKKALENADIYWSKNGL